MREELAREYVRRSEVMWDALIHLRSVLMSFDKGSRSVSARVERGEPVLSIMGNVSASEMRSEISVAIASFEKRRREARGVLIRLATEEGATMIEVAKSLGISRQLAHRLAAEAQAP